MNIDYIKQLAGLTPELLQEAREDNIAQSQGNKLIQIYNKKEPHPFDRQPIELIKSIAQQTNPKHIQWTITQYIQDPTFTIDKLPQIKQLQTQYDNIKQQKTNINQLTIKQLTELVSTGVNQFNALVNRYYQSMKEAVKQGNGKFKLDTPSYVVYTPTHWDGSKCLRAANPTNTSLCTTYLEPEKRYYYEDYNKNGILDYILTPTAMYLCYIPTTDNKEFEFANQGNTHKLVPLPKAVKDTLFPDFKLSNNIFVMLAVIQPKMSDKLEQFIIDDINKYGPKLTKKRIRVATKYSPNLPDQLTDNIRQLLISNNVVPKLAFNIRIDFDSVYAEHFNNQPITTRTDFVDLCIHLYEHFDSVMNQFAEEHNIPQNDVTEYVWDNYNIDIGDCMMEYENNPVDWIRLSNTTQAISDNFPSFTGPDDCERFIEELALTDDILQCIQFCLNNNLFDNWQATTELYEYTSAHL